MEMHSCKRAKEFLCLLIVLIGVCGALGTSPYDKDQAQAQAAAIRGHDHVKSSRKLLAIPRSNSTDAQLDQVNPKACADKGETVKCKMNPCAALLCSAEQVCEVEACSCKARCKKAAPQAQTPGCADGSKPVQCLVDPCISATCEEGTVCEANYCGGCNHVCKELLTTDTNDIKVHTCSDGSEPVQCFVDPCEAQNFCKDGEICERDYCGGCNAVCKPAQLAEPQPSDTCSDGSSPVQCLVDPCITATCEDGTVCEANYCGGCSHVCKLAQLVQSSVRKTCSDGSHPVKCLVDPCSTARCKDGTVCMSDYCGGCKAVCRVPGALDNHAPK